MTLTEEAKKLKDYILDKSNRKKGLVFNLQDVKEIPEIGRKIERLLEELKEENVILSYDRTNEKSVSVEIKEDILPVSAPGGKYEMIHNRVMEQFIKKRYRDFAGNEDIFRQYSDLFKLFVRISDDELQKQEPEDIFQFVLD
ncbi:MAG: hypothetical protein NC318_07685 [Blautia sp.]|nr:hypothetical protein [Blautia sp.]MCM1219881.1 hypothetical protein [Lachnospiraceae bacterium]